MRGKKKKLQKKEGCEERLEPGIEKKSYPVQTNLKGRLLADALCGGCCSGLCSSAAAPRDVEETLSGALNTTDPATLQPAVSMQTTNLRIHASLMLSVSQGSHSPSFLLSSPLLSSPFLSSPLHCLPSVRTVPPSPHTSRLSAISPRRYESSALLFCFIF